MAHAKYYNSVSRVQRTFEGRQNQNQKYNELCENMNDLVEEMNTNNITKCAKKVVDDNSSLIMHSALQSSFSTFVINRRKRKYTNERADETFNAILDQAQTNAGRNSNAEFLHNVCLSRENHLVFKEEF